MYCDLHIAAMQFRQQGKQQQLVRSVEGGKGSFILMHISVSRARPLYIFYARELLVYFE